MNTSRFPNYHMGHSVSNQQTFFDYETRSIKYLWLVDCTYFHIYFGLIMPWLYEKYGVIKVLINDDFISLFRLLYLSVNSECLIKLLIFHMNP